MRAPVDPSTLDEVSYEAVFEHSLDGVLITIPDGRILAANPAACAIFGATEEEICRRGRQGFSDPGDPAWQAALEERRRNGGARAVAPMVRADGTPFLAEMSSAVFPGPRGEQRACVILRDVTGRIRLEQRLRAAHDVTHSLLAGEGTAEVLGTIARQARQLVDATDAAVVAVGEQPGSVVVVAGDGARMSALAGRYYPPGSLAARVMASGRSLLVTDLTSEAAFEDGRRLGLGPAMVVPIISGGSAFGNLIVGAEPGSRPYSADDLAIVETFAESAGVALALGEARADAQRVAVLAEQARIAADLHDSVLQQLFAAGLGLQSAAARAEASVSEQVRDVVRRLDDVIAEIRLTVYDLRSSRTRSNLVPDVRAVAAEVGAHLVAPPVVTLTGDTGAVAPDVAEQLVMVLREALSNVVRHAGATRVEVTVSVDDEVVLTVTDDGVGPPRGPTAGFGLGTMAERAAALHGSFSMGPAEPRGTRLSWRVPIRARPLPGSSSPSG